VQINGMVVVTPRGGKPILYITRADEAKVQALSLNGANVALSGGRIVGRPFLGNEEAVKTAKRYTREGTCAPGTFCTATLILHLDRNRRVSFPVRGPYDRGGNILFLQEFRPEASRGREIAAELSNIVGLDVELEKERLEFTER
jgi:hypothetical protein